MSFADFGLTGPAGGLSGEKGASRDLQLQEPAGRIPGRLVRRGLAARARHGEVPSLDRFGGG